MGNITSKLLQMAVTVTYSTKTNLNMCKVVVFCLKSFFIALGFISIEYWKRKIFLKALNHLRNNKQVQIFRYYLIELKARRCCLFSFKLIEVPQLYARNY